jgi:hypothetical protein
MSAQDSDLFVPFVAAQAFDSGKKTSVLADGNLRIGLRWFNHHLESATDPVQVRGIRLSLAFRP